jgi:hypothetical protein
MSKIIHGALNVRGFLKNARFPRGYRGVFRHDDGRLMTPDEARNHLLDELARGHELIPVGACDDFDYSAGGGCRGHDRPDSEAMGLTRPAEGS